MAQGTILLNDDGTASMATMLMMSHHAFRRDIARFLRAIDRMGADAASRGARWDALREEWDESFRKALHGHHTIEDTHMFPDLRKNHPNCSAAIDTLMEQHHQIDPLLEQGDAAFADPARLVDAPSILNELKTLLDAHLAFEESEITPFLRNATDFPAPADEAMIAMYAQGFAWSMQGIAPEVLVEVQKMLPEQLLAKLPAAQQEFEARCHRIWGEYSVGSATTSVPMNF